MSGTSDDAPTTGSREERRPRLPRRVISTAATFARGGLKDQVQRWHRLEVSVVDPPPDEPTIYVTHHGFGGSFDLNIFAAVAIIENLTDRRARVLAHRDLWKIGAGRLVEALGAVPAGREATRETLAKGEHVLVVPGGNYDSVKTWRERNTLTFHGRSGFVSMARLVGCPIVPIVTAGAAETVIVLSKGERIIARMRRQSTDRETPSLWPVTISMPWGLSAGTAGILPYAAPPVKFESMVLPAVRPADDLTDAEVAHAIEADMQAALTELTTGRVPFLGRVGRRRRRTDPTGSGTSGQDD